MYRRPQVPVTTVSSMSSTPLSQRLWFIQQGDEIVGPVSSKEVKSLLERGEIDEQTKIRKAEIPNWKPAGQLKWLFPEENQGFFGRLRSKRKRKTTSSNGKRKRSLAEISREQDREREQIRFRIYVTLAVAVPLCVGLMFATLPISGLTFWNRVAFFVGTSVVLWLVTLPTVAWQFFPEYRDQILKGLKIGIPLVVGVPLVIGVVLLVAKIHRDGAPVRKAIAERNANSDAILELAAKHRPDLDHLETVRSKVLRNLVQPIVIVHLPPGSEVWRLHPHNDRLPARLQTGDPERVGIFVYVKTLGTSRTSEKVLTDRKRRYYYDAWKIQLTVYEVRTKKVLMHVTGMSRPPKREYFNHKVITDGMPGSDSGFSKDGEAWFQAYDKDTFVAEFVDGYLTQQSN